MRSSVLMLLVVVGAVLAVACGGAASTTPDAAPHPAEVRGAPREAELSTITLTTQAVGRLGIETATVERSVIRRTRTLGGELVVPSGRRVSVGAPVAGRLIAPASGRQPAAGSRVGAQEELLRLIPIGPPDTDLIQREAEAQARFDAARTRATRAEQLLRDRAGSQRQLEESRSELSIAEAALQAVRSQRRIQGADGDGGAIESAAWSLRAPFRGRLGAVHVAPGQTVTAATPLFEVLADDPLWVRVPVYAGDLSIVDREAPATVQAIGAGSSWSAEAETRTASRATPIDAPPSADARAGTVDLFYRLANGDGALQPGLSVAVTLALQAPDALEASLVVPHAALLYDMHGGTWIYENTAPGEYVRRRVEVDRVVGDRVALARGPAPGTAVVTLGSAELFGTEFGVGH